MADSSGHTEDYVHQLEVDLAKSKGDVQGLESRAGSLENTIEGLEKRLSETEIKLIVENSQLVDAKLDLKAAQDELNTDLTTGVGSKRFMLKELRTHIDHTLKYKGRYSFLFLLSDLDGFKPVNDRIGYHAGDAVLRKVAQLYKSVLPENCIIGRWYQGDELAVIIPILNLVDGKELDKAYGLTERVKDEIARGNPHTYVVHVPDEAGKLVPVEETLPKDIRITLSTGAVKFDPDKHKHRDSLIKEAAKGLKIAKNRGKNRVVIMGEHSIYSGGDSTPKTAYSTFELIPVAIRNAYNSFKSTFTGER
jgi:diguanylate cyclase (GGDEF)-like protein